MRRLPRNGRQGFAAGPDLTSGKWLWGDGGFAAIAHTITVGVPRPKEYGAPMPCRRVGPTCPPPRLRPLQPMYGALGHRSGR